MTLQRYHQKRNFRRTGEPVGKEHAAKRGARRLTFVIQKHAASRLHYDFRLEMEGVLRSWAVPKGVPMKKGERRLAMHVEDHPLEYGGFEGVIPEGNYGAGSVMLWDRGEYESVEGDPVAAYRKGKLKIRLIGKKLKGEWTLVRMKGGGQGDPWLLLKSESDLPALSLRQEDRSVLSGQSMQQIADHPSREWKSDRPAQRRTPLPRRKPPAWERMTQDLPREKPGYIPPMKARLVSGIPPGGGWLWEIKWDGYRGIAVCTGGEACLYTRSRRNVTSDFPEIASALERLPVKDLVLDGEIVALDPAGHPSFQLMQNHRRQLSDEARSICYYIFDLLHLEGRNLRRLSTAQRKEVLAALVPHFEDPLRHSAVLQGAADRLLAEAQRQRIEGLIGKREEAPYQPDARSGAWVKVKCVNEQEFVIGGYTEPQGSRPLFGALLVGYYAEGRLQFASKVGTGFDHRLLRDLHRRMQSLRRSSPPFDGVPRKQNGRWFQGLSPAAMRRCTWVEPKLVCQVRFTEWTAEGGLRHPVYLGLREDKEPRQVVREIPQQL